MSCHHRSNFMSCHVMSCHVLTSYSVSCRQQYSRPFSFLDPVLSPRKRFHVLLLSETNKTRLRIKPGTGQGQVRNMSGTGQEQVGNRSETGREQVKNMTSTGHERHKTRSANQSIWELRRGRVERGLFGIRSVHESDQNHEKVKILDKPIRKT